MPFPSCGAANPRHYAHTADNVLLISLLESPFPAPEHLGTGGA